MTDTPIPVCLSIAGSDSSAGAGIQQDLKTFTALGVYGATALTAVTAQTTLGVQAVEPLGPHIVRAQITAVMSDLGVQAVKIGMLPDAAVVRTVADALVAERERRPRGMPHIVCDPVMVSTSGQHAGECTSSLREVMAQTPTPSPTAFTVLTAHCGRSANLASSPPTSTARAAPSRVP